MAIFKEMGYKPSRGQMAFHKETTDCLVSGGWRAGKSMLLAAEAVPHTIVPSPRPFLIALIGPTYKEPRSEFDYIVEFLSVLLPKRDFDPSRHVSRPKDGACELTIPAMKVKNEDGSVSEVYRATVRTYTAAEAESIRSFNAEGVILCEAGGFSQEAFFNIFGRVLSTGGFVIGSGTLEFSQKWYYGIIKNGRLDDPPNGIKSFTLPSWFNRTVFPGGRDDEKILRLERILPRDLFDVRVGAEPIRLVGIAVGEASRDCIDSESTQYNRSYPVELAIDPGYAGGYAVLAIQFYEGKIRIIDEVYARLLATPDIIAIVKNRPWFEGVNLGNAGVIDRAAKQHTAAHGDSVLEVWADVGEINLDLTDAVIPVEDGLDQLRIHLNSGRVLINPKCRGLLGEWDLGAFPEGFETYEPWHYKANPDGNLVGDKALTGADHASTAFIYYLVHRFGYITPEAVLYGPTYNWLTGVRMADRQPYGYEEANREVVGVYQDDNYGAVSAPFSMVG